MAQARYQIRLKDTSFVTKAILTADGDDIRHFDLQRRLNDFDILTLAINGNDPRVPLFTLDSIIEVWRRIDRVGAEWYREAICLHRTPSENLTEGQHQIFTSYSRGLNDFLRRREIRYKAETAYTKKTGVGETVMKSYVEQNMGPSATNPPRISSGVMANFSVQADGGLGDSWSGSKAYQNLLAVLQDISLTTSVDFEVVETGGAFEFRTYYPQRGVDRTATVRFAPEQGNVQDPVYTISRTEEANSIAVLGQGQQSNRRVIVRTSPDIADSPWNLCEKSTDGRNESTTLALQKTGDAELEKLQKQVSFEFQALQTDVLQYGVDYNLGDLVTVSFKTATVQKKLVAVRINVRDGQETVDPEFQDVPG